MEVEKFDINAARQKVKQMRKNKRENEISIDLQNKKSESTPEKELNEVSNKSYELNKTKALNKKRFATDRQNVEVMYTGGGCKVLLNTGCYELLKYFAEQYFIEDKSRSCKKVAVTDASGFNVETQYKLSDGKSSLYTLNLYHTSSSFLVNGKKVNLFMEKDFPKIPQRIENSLSANDTNISEINNNISKLLQLCKSKHEYENTEVAAHLNDCCESNENAEENKQQGNENITTNNINENEPCSVQVSNDISPDAETSDSPADDSAIIKMMNELKNEIQGLKSTITECVKNTDRQVSQLRDEITSIKKHISLTNSQTNNQVDTLSEHTMKIENEISTNAQIMQRKLQAVQDTLKYLKERERNTVQPQPVALNTKPTVTTPQNEELNPGNNGRNSLSQTPRKSPMQRQFSHNVIIGDSIIKGIHQKGLTKESEIVCNRGAISKEISLQIRNCSMDECKNVVIYVGGNDISSKTPVSSVIEELRTTIDSLQQRDIKPYLCTMCPRVDANVSPLNIGIRDLCVKTNTALIDVFPSFVYGDGSTVSHFYHRDGIHLNQTGSTTLLTRINRCLKVIPDKKVSTNTTGFPLQSTPIQHRRTFRSQQSLQQATPEGFRKQMSRHRNYTKARYSGDGPIKQFKSRYLSDSWNGCENCGLSNHVTRDCRRSF